MKEMKETILPIKGFETYSISNFGYVISHYKNKPSKILKNILSMSGFYCVLLSSSSQKKQCYIHKLVADHFIKECDYAIHKDGVKTNNHVDNLEAMYGELKSKMKHHCQITKPRSVIVTDPKTGISQEFHSMYRASKFLEVTVGCICNTCNGRQKTVKNMLVKYKD